MQSGRRLSGACLSVLNVLCFTDDISEMTAPSFMLFVHSLRTRGVIRTGTETSTRSAPLTQSLMLFSILMLSKGLSIFLFTSYTDTQTTRYKIISETRYHLSHAAPVFDIFCITP